MIFKNATEISIGELMKHPRSAGSTPSIDHDDNESQFGHGLQPECSGKSFVVVPPSAGIAIESLVRAYRESVRPAARIFVTPQSFPELAVLTSRSEKSK
jgi:hypothetical protein